VRIAPLAANSGRFVTVSVRFMMEEDYTDIFISTSSHDIISNGNTNIPSHGNTNINIKKISKYE